MFTNMDYFYTITKADAALITQFSYAKNQVVNPFVGEQKDGTYLVSQKMYEMLKNYPEFKKIDWTNIPLVPFDQLDPKEEGNPKEINIDK